MNSKILNYILKEGLPLLLIGGLVIVAIFLGIKWQYTNSLLQEELQSSALQEIEFVELQQGLARAESKVVSEKQLRAELELVYTEQYNLIQEDLKKLKAKPYIISHTTQVVEGGVTVIEDTNFPPEYLFTSRDGMSLASYTYEDRIFKANSYDLTVNSSIIISIDKYGNQMAHVIGSIQSSEDDHAYPMTITNSELNFVRPKINSIFFAPHLMGGLSLGASLEEPDFSAGGSLTLSAFAVGKTKSDNIVRFPAIRGTVGNDEVGISLDPIMGNIGKVLPLVDDIWLGAGIGISNKGTVIHGTISSTF